MKVSPVDSDTQGFYEYGLIHENKYSRRLMVVL